MTTKRLLAMHRNCFRKQTKFKFKNSFNEIWEDLQELKSLLEEEMLTRVEEDHDFMKSFSELQEGVQ